MKEKELTRGDVEDNVRVLVKVLDLSEVLLLLLLLLL